MSTPMAKASRIIGSGQRLGAAAVGVLALGLVAVVYGHQRQADAAEAAFWRMDGPACPTVNKAAYDAAPGKANVTDYAGVRYAYRVGHMMCIHRPDAHGGGDHPVCQFTGPDLLAVRTAEGERYFTPLRSRPARVAVENGVTRCVIISGFAMRDHK